MDRRGRDMDLLGPLPLIQKPTSGKNIRNTELLPGKQGVPAPHWAPQTMGPSVDRQAPEMTGFEDHQDFHLGELKVCRKPRLCSGRAHTYSFALNPSAEVLAWEARCQVWERFVDYFRAYTKGQGFTGDLSRDRGTGGHHFSYSPSASLTQWGQAQFFASSIYSPTSVFPCAPPRQTWHTASLQPSTPLPWLLYNQIQKVQKVHTSPSGHQHTDVHGPLNFWGPQDWKNRRDRIWQATNHRALHKQQPNLTPRLSVTTILRLVFHLIRRNKHRESCKMRRQRNICQIKEQDKTSEKDINEMEINNLHSSLLTPILLSFQLPDVRLVWALNRYLPLPMEAPKPTVSIEQD